MLSTESLKVLQALNVPYPIPEDRLPKNVDLSLIPFLLERKMVKKVSLVPPDRECEYPYGLWAYIIDSPGVEVLQEAHDELQKEAKQDAKQERDYRIAQERSDKLVRKDARRSWIQFWIRVLIDITIFFLGVYLGGATNTFQWFVAIFH